MFKLASKFKKYLNYVTIDNAYCFLCKIIQHIMISDK